MSKISLLAIALVLVVPNLTAKDKAIMPLVVTNATYALVTTYDGSSLSPELTPGDRQAIADVQKAIEKWGHYKLVYNPNEADLILVVRTGRTVETKVGLQRGTTIGPGAGPGGSAETLGGEAGDPEDSLSVYVASQDLKTSPPLWLGRAVNGLRAPGMALMKEFESRVEASMKKKP